ncbi:Solute carrier family 25 member 40 [Escovopsis weberi]|uniref:Solute carrier family 25 member 40 n=1 Tax=Escovopsis weberi TaxID=150374 RepID=A0A0M9VWE6_ESCWE|nr:Solute carrier family 25 member 40 [Escovopsis weberi]
MVSRLRNAAPVPGPSQPASPFPDSGILPVLPSDALPDRHPRNNAATGASAAGVRALSAQLVAFYFRAPAKAFFRTRVDYLAYARTVHQEQMLQRAAVAEDGSRMASALRQVWYWMRSTTPGVLTSAIKHEGWGVVPHQIMPPLIANIGAGVVLYTSYLQILGRLHPESSKATKRAYPPPSPGQTFTAGFLAGSIQSVFAAPLDALQARYDHRDMMMTRDATGRSRSMWTFGVEKLREIGVRGIFAGWGLSFAKDSLGCAIFFSTFEYVKAQAYYRFVTWYYGGLDSDVIDLLANKRPGGSAEDGAGFRVIRPHYALEPIFLLAAGISASFTQQLLLHPLTHFQVKHWDHLEDLDEKAAKPRAPRATTTCGQPGLKPNVVRLLQQQQRNPFTMLRAYYRAYQETWATCTREAASEGLKIGRWLYRGFWWNAIRQVPSTSAGLIIFELIRRKYGYGSEDIKIQKDGYGILLH